MVDVDRTLKTTVNKGTVHIGAKQTKQAIEQGKAKLVVLAINSPNAEEITSLSKEKKIPVYSYGKNSVDLGYACGKNFPVSVLAVLDEGDSNIMHLLKQKK